MHQAGQPALPGVGQVHREKVSLRNTVGCAPRASCFAPRISPRSEDSAKTLHQDLPTQRARRLALAVSRDAGGGRTL